MLYAWVIAICVGGATMLGGVLGYFIKYRNSHADGAVFSFAAGIMTTASFAELILPVVDRVNVAWFIVCIAGLIGGGLLIELLQKLLSAMQRKRKTANAAAGEPQTVNSGLLFVWAIAIHNLPEGLAAGVGLGLGDLKAAFAVAAGIVLQNIPEGMIVLPPLVHNGMRREKALLISVLTGVVEIIGAMAGYFAASSFQRVLPFFLCFAAGAMLYIICTDILTDAARLAGKTLSGFSYMLGCCAMLIMEKFI